MEASVAAKVYHARSLARPAEEWENPRQDLSEVREEVVRYRDGRAGEGRHNDFTREGCARQRRERRRICTTRG